MMLPIIYDLMELIEKLCRSGFRIYSALGGEG